MNKQTAGKKGKMKENKLMYVEDDKDTLNAVQIILQKQGIDVIGASNGSEGLSKLSNSEDLDLVLLDIMLPDISGWEVYRKIREKDKKIKIAFVSAIPISLEKLHSLKDEGVVDYITKPFERHDFLKRIKKAFDS